MDKSKALRTGGLLGVTAISPTIGFGIVGSRMAKIATSESEEPTLRARILYGAAGTVMGVCVSGMISIISMIQTLSTPPEQEQFLPVSSENYTITPKTKNKYLEELGFWEVIGESFVSPWLFVYKASNSEPNFDAYEINVRGKIESPKLNINYLEDLTNPTFVWENDPNNNMVYNCTYLSPSNQIGELGYKATWEKVSSDTGGIPFDEKSLDLLCERLRNDMTITLNPEN